MQFTSLAVLRNVFVWCSIVVGPFTEIKTGYRGFEMNEFWYFVYLLLALKIFSTYMNKNLQLEMAFTRYY